MSQVPQNFRAFIVFTVGLVLGLGLSVGRTVQADLDTQAKPSSSPLHWQDAKLLADVLKHVREEYVDPISDEALIRAAIKGLMSDLDPHSAFLYPEQLADMRIATRGEYSGVGLEVEADDDEVRVVTPIEGGPAQRAGVRAGDRIVAIDDQSVDASDLKEAVERMRGKEGSKVKLTLARPAVATPLELTLTRSKVHVSSVKAHVLEPGAGYVRITHFSETTASDLERAILRLEQENGRALTGLVLDLRDNPGGLLEAGVAVADAFLHEGVIVTAQGRAHDARFSMSAEPGDLLDGAPLTVLVNRKSASAAEIVAGALRDHGRATLVGHQTYGKGSVQTVVPLSGGHAIKLTTSRYYTPSGASIHATGITPDVVLDGSSEQAQVTVEAGRMGDPVADGELRVALQTLDALAAERVPPAERYSAAQQRTAP